MCGRYTLYSSPEYITKYFKASSKYNFEKSYNIAPTVIIPVLIKPNQERIIVPMRWGLIPSWYKNGQKMSVLNNAKIETIDTKPSYRTSFKRQRCLILANGFYEWDSTTKPKQPYYFHHKDDQPIALAGIWSRWVNEDQTIDSCCIITTIANTLVSEVHDRMPVIITLEDYDYWLDSEIRDTNSIKEIALKINSYENIICYPVTPRMNRVAYNSDNCIQSIKNGSHYLG